MPNLLGHVFPPADVELSAYFLRRLPDQLLLQEIRAGDRMRTLSKEAEAAARFHQESPRQLDSFKFNFLEKTYIFMSPTYSQSTNFGAA